MIRINLLGLSKSNNLLYTWISIGIFILTSFFYVFLCQYNMKTIAYLENIKNEPNLLTIANTDKEWIEQYHSLTKKLETVNNKLKVLQKPMISVVILPRMFAALPEEIVLTKVQNNRHEVVLEGESTDYEQVGIWVSRLKKISELREVHLKNIQGVIPCHFTIMVDLGGEDI